MKKNTPLTPPSKRIILPSYTPSRTLQKAAVRLLEKYGPDEIQKRMEHLQRNMRLESKVVSDNEIGVLDDFTSEREALKTAAKDIIKIRNLIMDIAEGKELKLYAYDSDGKVNTSLLVNRRYEGLPSSITMCLRTTADWYENTMDELDEQATQRASSAPSLTRKDLKAATRDIRELDAEAGRIAKLIMYHEETAQMLFDINTFAQKATKEIEVVRKKKSRGLGAA
jgi:hypothetical protein